MKITKLVCLLGATSIACMVGQRAALKQAAPKQVVVMDPVTISCPVPQVKDGFQHFKLEGRIEPQMTDDFIANTNAIDPNAKGYIIDINSVGGEIPSGHRIARAIMLLDKPSYCIVDGDGDSMALYILQVCDVRIMTKRSQLLLHGPAQEFHEFRGKKGAFQNVANELRTLEIALVEQYCTKMKLTEKQILKMIDDKDVWLDWKLADKYGAVDKVVDTYQDGVKLALNNWLPTKPKPPAPAHKAKDHCGPRK